MWVFNNKPARKKTLSVTCVLACECLCVRSTSTCDVHIRLVLLLGERKTWSYIRIYLHFYHHFIDTKHISYTIITFVQGAIIVVILSQSIRKRCIQSPRLRDQEFIRQTFNSNYPVEWPAFLICILKSIVKQNQQFDWNEWAEERSQ